MKVIAIGGSNTILKNGYLSKLKSLMPEMEIVNRAIGAANSSMGLYRLLSYGDLSEGDIVIWEYALNDTFSLSARGEPWHLALIEQTINHARNKGCLFVPVILTRRGHDRMKGISAYRAMVHHLFRSYGLEPIDAAHTAHLRFNVAALPDSDYRDDSHYQPGGRVCRLVAEMIADQIGNGAPQPQLLPEYIWARPGFAPRVRTDLIGGTASKFENSLLSVDYRDTRGDQVITFDPQTPKGRVISVISLVSPGSGKCVVHTPKGEHIISFQPRPKRVTMSLLKTVVRKLHGIRTGPGNVFRFTPKDSTSDDGPRGIVAVLTEEPV